MNPSIPIFAILPLPKCSLEQPIIEIEEIEFFFDIQLSDLDRAIKHWAYQPTYVERGFTKSRAYNFTFWDIMELNSLLGKNPYTTVLREFPELRCEIFDAFALQIDNSDNSQLVNFFVSSFIRQIEDSVEMVPTHSRLLVAENLSQAMLDAYFWAYTKSLPYGNEKQIELKIRRQKILNQMASLPKTNYLQSTIKPVKY